MVNLKNFFEPKRVAVIGVSKNPNKIGHVIFKNIIDGGFKGEVFAVNPNADYILMNKVYKNIKDIEGKLDLAVIAVPAELVLKTIKECDSKGVKDVLIITAGFSENGNKDLENKLREALDKNKMRAIGVNCLGIYDAHNKLDTLFLPRYRLSRPQAGGISFVCQSGAVGSAIMDKATEKGDRFSKFISYGNATQIDEADLIEYLGEDEKTKVICLYVEGVKNGDKFFEVARRVSKKKPIIALKGGLTEQGMHAALSHTGSLAGKKEVYFGIFKQTGIIKADSLEEMFNIAGLVDKGVSFKGNRVQVITNGGGYGIISTDNIVNAGHLEMAKMEKKTADSLRKLMPKTVNIGNPLDLVGDATTERYKLALENCVNDKEIDAIFLIVLYQTPLVTTDIVDVISEINAEKKKPMVVVSTGAEFTENLSKSLEAQNIPVFDFPEDAVKTIDKLIWWEEKRKTL